MNDLYSCFFLAVFAIGLIGYVLRTSVISKMLSFYVAMGAIFFHLLVLSKSFSVSEGEVFSYLLVMLSGIQFVVGISIYVICRPKPLNEEAKE